jgi:LysM repeat protein
MDQYSACYRSYKGVKGEFKMKKAVNIISIVVLLALLLTPAPVTTLAQGGACDTDVVVQADDWLSKIADKFFGNVLAYQAIADATNAKAASDSSYATIDNVDVIEPGWKLCIPSTAEAQAALAGAAPAPTAQATRKIGFLAGVQDPFYFTMQRGAEQAAADFGIELVVQIPEEWNATVQTPMLDALVARGDLDFLFLAPVDKEAMIAPCKRRPTPVCRLSPMTPSSGMATMPMAR